MHRYPEWVVPSTAAECAVSSCAVVDGGKYKGDVDLGEPRRRRPVHGSELCLTHEKQLRRVLIDLSERLPLVRSAILRTPGNDGSRGRGSDVSDPVSQLWNPRATTVALNVQEYSDFLVGMVLTEYSTGDPHRDPDHGTLQRGLDARVALYALSKYYGDWIARYPGGVGPDVLDELLRLRRACDGALNGPSFRRVFFEGARCPEIVAEHDGGVVLCEAPMVGIIPNPGEPRAPELLCSLNPEHQKYLPEQWMQLALERERAGG